MKEMSFWSHLDELRGVLVKIAIVVTVLAVAMFAVMTRLFDSVILAPCDGDFVLYRAFDAISSGLGFEGTAAKGFHVELINIKLASQFYIHLSTSFWLALALSFPITLYLLWTFVSPALYPHEKKGITTAFALGNVMFFLGVAVGYFVVFPVTLRFLADYHVSQRVPNQISLESYIDTFMMLIFIMGLVFEMPLLAWLLGKIGVLDRRVFRRFRKHAVVVLLLVAAFITPTGDPFTLMVVFLPIYLLYEISALLVKVSNNKES